MTRFAIYAARLLPQGWTHFKLKVGGDPAERPAAGSFGTGQKIGSDNKLMMDANQKWDVLEAIPTHERTKPNWTPGGWREPTSPGRTILGHAPHPPGSFPRSG